MTCRFSDENGMCSIFDGTVSVGGVDENGLCVWEDDPDLLLACEEFKNSEVQI